MVIHSLINREAAKPVNSLKIKNNPFTAETLHEVFHADLLQAVSAIQQSQKFFAAYKLSSFAERTTLLTRIKSCLEENQLKWARLEALDQGLPLDFVLNFSMKSALHSLDEVLEELKAPNLSCSAVGVVSIICSWNLSLRLICERLFPAIAAGNTAVVKVSSSSPVTAAILTELIEVCDLPAGLIQVLIANDEDVKKILITHPGIKAVSFVGQLSHATEVMKWIASVTPQQFKKVQIASGTKNTAAAIAEPDDATFNHVIQSFLIGQGQLAWNSARLFVLEKNEKLWLQKIQNYLSELKPSESIDDKSLWTPVIKRESFKTFSELNALAESDQARLLKTGQTLTDRQQTKYLPIVFTQDMSNCSTLQQDQVMAPLFILSTVKYPFDIQKYSNVSYFGFAAHLWGEDEKLKKIADSLEVGLICRNKWSAEIFGPPKSVKQSGFGLQDYRAFGEFNSNVKLLA